MCTQKQGGGASGFVAHSLRKGVTTVQPFYILTIHFKNGETVDFNFTTMYEALQRAAYHWNFTGIKLSLIHI